MQLKFQPLPNEARLGNSRYYQLVTEFVESGEHSALVEELPIKPESARNAFAKVIKEGRFDVKATIIKGELWLIRV
jgi:hypothetical protein